MNLLHRICIRRLCRSYLVLNKGKIYSIYGTVLVSVMPAPNWIALHSPNPLCSWIASLFWEPDLYVGCHGTNTTTHMTPKSHKMLSTGVTWPLYTQKMGSVLIQNIWASTLYIYLQGPYIIQWNFGGQIGVIGGLVQKRVN